jgi:hypothetical protein
LIGSVEEHSLPRSLDSFELARRQSTSLLSIGLGGGGGDAGEGVAVTVTGGGGAMGTAGASEGFVTDL